MEKIKRIEKDFKTMAIKGKQYVEVKERIKYLAFDFDGNYSIETKFWHYPQSRTWVVKATLTMEQNGASSTYTGLAQEVESDSYKDVNHTSALENCETSAIGRACAMAGIGVDISIASADEMNKAFNRSAKNKTPQATPPVKTVEAKAPQENAQEKPPVEPITPAQQEEILKLNNNPVFSEEERLKVIEGMGKLNKTSALKWITSLRKKIDERKEVSHAS